MKTGAFCWYFGLKSKLCFSSELKAAAAGGVESLVVLTSMCHNRICWNKNKRRRCCIQIQLFKSFKVFLFCSVSRPSEADDQNRIGNVVALEMRIVWNVAAVESRRTVQVSSSPLGWFDLFFNLMYFCFRFVWVEQTEMKCQEQLTFCFLLKRFYSQRGKSLSESACLCTDTQEMDLKRNFTCMRSYLENIWLRWRSLLVFKDKIFLKNVWLWHNNKLLWLSQSRSRRTMIWFSIFTPEIFGSL